MLGLVKIMGTAPQLNIVWAVVATKAKRPTVVELETVTFGASATVLLYEATLALFPRCTRHGDSQVGFVLRKMQHLGAVSKHT